MPIQFSGAPRPRRFDIAINGTSLGMQAGDALPLRARGDTAIFPGRGMRDRARDDGAAQERAVTCQGIHTGVPMLAAQLDMMLEFMNINVGTASPN